MAKPLRNQITTILASKGSGKTMLSCALALANPKPTIVITPIEAGYPAHKFDKWNEFDIDQDFYEGITYLYQIDNKADFEDCLMEIYHNFKGVCVVIDELDFFYRNNPDNDSFLYKLINYGRHREIDLIVMCRRFQDMPKVVTAQTDIYFIGAIGICDANGFEYLRKTINKEVATMAQGLEVGNFIKVNNLQREPLTLIKLPTEFISKLERQTNELS